MTDVPRVTINFGTPRELCIDAMDITMAKKYLNEGQFGKGSMAPKVEAAVEFAQTVVKLQL